MRTRAKDKASMIIDFRGMEFAMKRPTRKVIRRQRDNQDSRVSQNMRNLFTALLS